MYLNKCNSWVWTIWIEDKLATLLTRRPKIGATDQQPKTSKREKKSSNGAISSRAHTRCMKFKIADIANTDHCSCWNCNIKMDQLLSIPAPSSREGSLSFPQKRVFVIPHSKLDSEHFAIVFSFNIWCHTPVLNGEDIQKPVGNMATKDITGTMNS